MKVGLIVYKRHGIYYCSFEVGRVPDISEGLAALTGSREIFRLWMDVNSLQELFDKARAEADRRGIGEVVNLPT